MLGDGCAHTQQSFWPSLGLEVDVWCLVGPQRAFLHSRHAVSKVRTSSHADLDQTRKGAAVTLELGDADLHESAPPPRSGTVHSAALSASTQALHGQGGGARGFLFPRACPGQPLPWSAPAPRPLPSEGASPAAGDAHEILAWLGNLHGLPGRALAYK